MFQTAVQQESVPPALDGLAGGVISRVRAESAQSWRAVFDRAFDDWHWTLVGAGSVASTFLTTTFLSMILAFGPAPRSEDSLSALISNLGSPAGMLFVYVAPSGDNGDSVLLQVDTGGPRASSVATELAGRRFAVAVARSGADRRVGRHDHASGPRHRPEHDAPGRPAAHRESHGRDQPPPAWSDPADGRARQVREVRLVTSTSVSAKGLSDWRSGDLVIW